MTLDVTLDPPVVSQANIRQFKKEYLVVNQMSLRAFFHTPLQLVGKNSDMIQPQGNIKIFQFYKEIH